MQHRRHAEHSLKACIVQKRDEQCTPSYREGTGATELWVKGAEGGLRATPKVDHSNQQGSHQGEAESKEMAEQAKSVKDPSSCCRRTDNYSFATNRT